jgi:16S rRNA (uracil1498-N3)-methyltransferase
MLWLAEKCAELAVSVWQPVVFRRSSSVSPRGEGEAFRRKVQARMIGALEQSGGAWLPEIHAEIPLAQALVSRQGDDVHRLLLDSGGARLVRADVRGAVDLLLGPEGGIDMSELDLLTRDHGWVPVSLAETTLRFETAGVVAVGIVRSRLGPA